MTFFLCALVLATAAPQPVSAWERMARTMVSEERLDAAAGFFAPVTKRYQPVFNRFVAEYETAPDKLAVIGRYLPKARLALGEARRMRVPPKYEREKQEYLRTFEALLAALSASVKLNRWARGVPAGAPAERHGG